VQQVLVVVVQYHKNIREKISRSRDEDKGEKKIKKQGMIGATN
jgi:hypothetical protein